MSQERIIFDADALAEVRRLLEAEPELSRTQLSRRLCLQFGWLDRSGRPREMSCRVALNALERAGAVVLPAPRKQMPVHRHRRRRRRVRAEGHPPRPIKGPLESLGTVHLEPVTAADPAASALWNELTGRHHYLGSGPLCGMQLRYLIRSANRGVVGTLAFTSSALHLEARDAWIGWDLEARRLHRDQVVCNARFLILPWVEVPNLASKVLSLCPGQVRADWLARYGVEPVLLETFVQRGRFSGGCYRAAGWQQVGRTKGRGRQDRAKRHAAGVKNVFVLPLRDDFRAVLAAKPPTPPVPVYYMEPDGTPWTRVEFGGARLGDERRTARLECIAAAFYAKPTANIPEACGSRAAARATYRFLKEKDVSMQAILAPHFEATAGRVAAAGGTVLAVQDTTSLNYSTHRAATEGLGPIGSTADGPVGMLLHDTMVFTPQGVPLGLLDIQCWARDPEQFGSSDRRRGLPVDEKESGKWFESYRAASELQRRLPQARVVSVGDREADIYELFDEATRTESGARVLVRANHNRRLADDCSWLKDEVRKWQVESVFEVDIPRSKDGKARGATLHLRFGTVRLAAPRGHKGVLELAVQVVHVAEADGVAEDERIEWFLLTDCPVDAETQAREVFEWYTKRWGIEIFHRIIKSGCRSQDRQLHTETRLENCLAIDLVVAWRVFHLTMLGRDCPKLPASVCLDDPEWKMLCVKYTRKLPAKPPTLDQAVKWLGTLGGWIGNPRKTMPGPMTIWRGLITLLSMAEGWRLACTLGMPAGP